MTILKKPMGDYMTNCYIVTIDDKDIIIDPGIGATSWVIENCKNPAVILNTHGHFDHVWSNSELKQRLNIPIYCPVDDCFMLENDPFEYGTPRSKANLKVSNDEAINIGNQEVIFHHFPGHTPGCSAIQIQNHLFCGDFIFENSIGRSDFPFSNSQDMQKSIKKILSWSGDFVLHPGHGNDTTLNKERSSLKSWLD